MPGTELPVTKDGSATFTEDRSSRSYWHDRKPPYPALAGKVAVVDEIGFDGDEAIGVATDVTNFAAHPSQYVRMITDARSLSYIPEFASWILGLLLYASSR